MPFKYINGRLIPVKHKTVFGRLVEVGGLHGKSDTDIMVDALIEYYQAQRKLRRKP